MTCDSKNNLKFEHPLYIWGGGGCRENSVTTRGDRTNRGDQHVRNLIRGIAGGRAARPPKIGHLTGRP